MLPGTTSIKAYAARTKGVGSLDLVLPFVTTPINHTYMQISAIISFQIGKIADTASGIAKYSTEL